MLRKILIILFLFLSNLLFAQEWSEPILISTMQGYNDNPDFCVDSNGVIHCVWSHKIEDNYRKIYYSKSGDGGDSWTEPEDISLNDTMWMSKPYIACDSESNLYLTYNYNTANYYDTQVHLRKFNGISWSDSIVVSEGYPGSNNAGLTVDQNERLYVFWYFGELFYYKYYENDNWSNVLCPYDSENYHSFIKTVCDSENNLHCLGSFHYSGQTHYQDRIVYFKYDFNNDQWSDITFLSDITMGVGYDIALDQNGYPHVVWRQSTPLIDSTLYSYFDGDTWIEPQAINKDKDSYYQVVAVDSLDNIHIIVREKTSYGYQLVHYFNNSINWEKKSIDSAGQSLSDSKLLVNQNKLKVIYDKCIESGDTNNNIMFSKYDIVTNTFRISSEANKFNISQNYPNPFKDYTVINFSVNKNGYTSLKIFNLKGRLIKILVNDNKNKGDYSVIWDGTDQKGNKVTSGIYLYRLQVDKYCMTRSLIITN